MKLVEAIAAGDLLETARAYVALGLSVVPARADGSKRPYLSSWGEYQERLPADDELKDWFAPNRPVGVAVVCGKVSGNLAVIDFERQSAWERWHERCAFLGITDIFAACPLVRTPRGGRHLYCSIDKHAFAGGRLATLANKELIIEVRGEGNIVVAPGSPLACHPLNVAYTVESWGWLNG